MNSYKMANSTSVVFDLQGRKNAHTETLWKIGTECLWSKGFGGYLTAFEPTKPILRI